VSYTKVFCYLGVTRVYSLAKRPSINKIPMASINSDSYSEQELLEQFKGAINLIEDPISRRPRIGVFCRCRVGFWLGVLH
jgi:hypothetical protein